MALNLMLHCGGKEAIREEVWDVKTPDRTSTYCPIAHSELVGMFEDELHRLDLRILSEAHGLSHEGQRYFGMFEVANGIEGRDYNTVVGLRNSHDKVLPTGAACGSGVFVCDNLCFSGEVTLARKHTPNIMRDLPHLVSGMVDQVLGILQPKMERRIDSYREVELPDVVAHDTMIRAVKRKALIPSKLPRAITEWDTPAHPEFEVGGKTGWRLFNAFTEAMKGTSPHELVDRTMAIHEIMDDVCGTNEKTYQLN